MDRVESAKCSFLFDLLDFVDNELDVGREKVNVDEPLELGKGYAGIFDKNQIATCKCGSLCGSLCMGHLVGHSVGP